MKRGDNSDWRNNEFIERSMNDHFVEHRNTTVRVVIAMETPWEGTGLMELTQRRGGNEWQSIERDDEMS